ncbi:hypothetical protein SAMN05443428_10855 [Caloramator quimbayensis]|uniref:4Fe-4S ferredoxin-type domain-containing protein n=1 Tax=Caloramator quimbayensis TaxID=1147123 RepID=A0A1T4XE09_9CLOT|nr:4Fe-4S binding protein [Caloramator quimbayensis]SKA87790.1 hypothetical protein SAMN05443428_10855 [Caloramator quimbayensis]
MKKRWTDFLYLVTILFFALGFFNILFAWLGFLCMIIPFALLLKNRKKTWCQGYCPRASLFNFLFKGRSLTGKAVPRWLTQGKFKLIFLFYFCINLTVLILSTIMVFKGKNSGMERIRFMMIFQLPWKIPQLIKIEGISRWAVHLSYRIYSMMFTTTTIGLILGFLFKPRTWCTICPVNTISDVILYKRRVS